MRRRDLVGILGYSVILLPQVSRSQSKPNLRRVGVLVGTGLESQGQWRKDAIREGLQAFGWVEGQNIEILYRWGEGGGEETIRRHAEELVAAKPDVLFGTNTLAVNGLRAATSSIPIVFTNVTDPIGSGFVQTLSRPGGNITGFTDMGPAVSGKWVELLKEVAPRIGRVAMMYNPPTAPFVRAYFSAFESAGRQYGLAVNYMTLQSREEYAAIIEGCSRHPLSGLIVIDDGLFNRNRDLVITLATQYRVPAMFNHAAYVTAGGLISYGIALVDLYKQSVSYVHRILMGERPRDLPVQSPTSYMLSINMKTAGLLGLTVPPELLLQADLVVD